ncbi:hypothetical protein UCRPC4_g03332 [Phaeomoniella chlamydospora]|uniref:Uncharacterized protein n=1 Tax=Phaeomoniella chlamydospora TaxID=158046 RepID=A0A0G2GZW8_PHACM|nr:hypothetical protein UCRPC4_g03332 [Phaeomoniella chlamydospora]
MGAKDEDVNRKEVENQEASLDASKYVDMIGWDEAINVLSKHATNQVRKIETNIAQNRSSPMSTRYFPPVLISPASISSPWAVLVFLRKAGFRELRLGCREAVGLAIEGLLGLCRRVSVRLVVRLRAEKLKAIVEDRCLREELKAPRLPDNPGAFIFSPDV